jgi:hypothetical protein
MSSCEALHKGRKRKREEPDLSEDSEMSQACSSANQARSRRPGCVINRAGSALKCKQMELQRASIFHLCQRSCLSSARLLQHGMQSGRPSAWLSLVDESRLVLGLQLAVASTRRILQMYKSEGGLVSMLKCGARRVPMLPMASSAAFARTRAPAAPNEKF